MDSLLLDEIGGDDEPDRIAPFLRFREHVVELDGWLYITFGEGSAKDVPRTRRRRGLASSFLGCCTPRVAGHGLEGMKRGSITPCRLEGYSYPRNASISMFESGIFRFRSSRRVPTTMLGVPVT